MRLTPRASPATRSHSRDGRRISTNEAYLEPARARPNLEIRGDALVDRVILRDGRATGVRVRLTGQGWTDIPARQVLLCAGAIHSPAILLRSGIGPGGDLAALGIPVLHDNPHVGRHFMDHPVLRASSVSGRSWSPAIQSTPYQLLPSATPPASPAAASVTCC